ncbi:DUF551 domain-containing protein [Escherichia coli]|uniref:DUF551 domain-containing protein n=1 Tax=Escherichia coli TaxID=562 RepID=UPI00289370FE|nr:DUF551 domain-containing protein [Escherichia coli]MDC9053648.1 DUF551 domain-containing protein [Escherichia coli]
MSKIDYQALRYGDNVLWFMNELAAYDASDIDGGEFDVYGEDSNGLEGCATIDVTELAADDAKLIEAAEKRIAELESLTAPQLTQQSVPDEMTPEMMRAVQLNSELGAYAVSNLSGAYEMFSEFWKVACRAAMLQGAKPVSQTYKLNELSGNSPVTPDGWISCSERMPDTKTAVLVAVEFDRKGDWRMKWATYIPGHPDANNGWIIPGASWKPSHWMPLPEPPQEAK